jgi:hypothetical protein
MRQTEKYQKTYISVLEGIADCIIIWRTMPNLRAVFNFNNTHPIHALLSEQNCTIHALRILNEYECPDIEKDTMNRKIFTYNTTRFWTYSNYKSIFF